MQVVIVSKGTLDVPALNDFTSLGIYMLLRLVEVVRRSLRWQVGSLWMVELEPTTPNKKTWSVDDAIC